jgi:hypothetical protein
MPENRRFLMAAKFVLPKTSAEWDAWEAEEASKDSAYVDEVLNRDPDIANPGQGLNSSPPFNLDSFKKTSRDLIAAYAGVDR